MSLLDILTGMLGAFLFLMLGLVPYYTKAKNSAGSGDSTPPVDTVLNIAAQWNNPAVKLDFFLLTPDGKWHGPNEKSIPLSRRTKIVDNSCSSAAGWQTTSTFASANQHYLLACSVQWPPDIQSMSAVSLTIELMEAQSNPKGSGLQGYYPQMWCTMSNVSGIKPGQIYGLMWIDVTKDEGKKEYYRQFDFNYFPATKYPLPSGVSPVPPGLPIPAPVPAVAPTNPGALGFPSFPMSTNSATPHPVAPAHGLLLHPDNSSTSARPN